MFAIDVCLFKTFLLETQLWPLHADQKLNEIVGSAYYVAPEVLLRSYGTEADIWSVGVIAYILLCGTRPFWARTESGIFQAVLKTNPSFNESPWPTLSSESKDFVRCLLRKDPRRRITAAQALCESLSHHARCQNFHLLLQSMICCLQVIHGFEITIS